MEESVELIYAEKGKKFQEYTYSDGTRVPAGEPIGVEINGKLKLLNGIYYLNE